jgi:hypothetical protein
MRVSEEYLRNASVTLSEIKREWYVYRIYRVITSVNEYKILKKQTIRLCD